MIKKIVFVIGLLIVIAAFAACNQPDKSNEKAQETKTSEIISPTPTVTTVPEKKSILGTKLNDTGSILSVTNQIITQEKQNLVLAVLYTNQQLLVIKNINGEKTELSIYNIYSGKTEYETELPYLMDSVNYIFLENGDIFLIDQSYNKYYIFDSHLNLIQSADDKLFEYNTATAAKDGSSLYYTSADSRRLFRFDMKNKKSELLWEVEKPDVYVLLKEITDNNDMLLATYTDYQQNYGTVLFHLKDNSAEYLDGMDASMEHNNNQFIMMDYKMAQQGMIEFYNPNNLREVKTFAFDEPTEADYFRLSKDGSNILTICNYQIMGEEAEQSNHTGNYFDLKWYDTTTGKIEKRDGVKKEDFESIVRDVDGDTEYNEVSFYRNNFISITEDNNIVCINYYAKGKTGALIWDMSLSSESQEITQPNLYLHNNPQAAIYKNNELKKSLEEEYHVVLYLRDEAVRFFPDFAVVPIHDELVIHQALVKIKAAFEKYPKGFFKEFQYGDIKGIEIFLCGMLVQGSEYGISSPGAYALTYNNKQLVVMNINNLTAIETNLAHELMHAIDSKMSYLSVNKKVKANFFDKWMDLNPKGFEYYYSYVDQEGNEYNSVSASKYTMEDSKSQNNINNVYFVDYYAKTFVIEDRARVFENLMASEDELPACFESEKLKAKAQLLTEMIRKTLSCMKDVEQAHWERYLE